MYTLRFPFEIITGIEISGLEQQHNASIEDLELSFKYDGRFYIVTIEGLNSYEEAEEYKNRVWAGLMWVLLSTGISFKANLNVSQIIYSDDIADSARKQFNIPEDVDRIGIGDDNFPLIFKTGDYIKIMGTYPPTISIIRNIERIASVFIEGIFFKNSSQIVLDERLRTSLDLYSTNFFEVSNNSKFISLVMALEVLSKRGEQPQFILEILERWRNEIKQLNSKNRVDLDELFAIQSLERSILFQRERSIRSSIRDLVLETFTNVDDVNEDDLSRRAVRVYDQRSTLVHEGFLEEQELEKAIEEVRYILELILRLRIANN